MAVCSPTASQDNGLTNGISSLLPAGAFITHLAECGFKRYGSVTTTEDFEIHNLDLTSLNLDVGILTPFVISKRLSGYRIVNSEQFT
jgi:hypothetical protein